MVVRNPDRCPTHPGELLRDDILPALKESRGVTKAQIADFLDISRTHLYAVLNEESPVSPNLAARFGKLFGNSAAFWINMQAAYDAWHATREVDVSRIPTLELA